MTLILQSSSAIKTPIFPNIDSLDPDLMILLRAADITGVAEGAQIGSIVARGNGDVRVRTFDEATTGWNKPLFTTAGGRKALQFTGNNQLKNYAGETTYDVMPAPFTLFYTLRIDDYAGQGSAPRLISAGTVTGDPSTRAGSISPSTTAGSFNVGFRGVSATVDAQLPAGTWGTIGFVYNGDKSLFIGATGVVTPITTFPADFTLRSFRLGGNGSAPGSPATGFKGQMSLFQLMKRAMGEADLKTARAAIAA